MEIMKVSNKRILIIIIDDLVVFFPKADDSSGTSHSSDVENSDCEGLKCASSPSPSPSPKPQNYDFQLCVDCKSSSPIAVHLYAPSLQEKTAWVSDISQVSTVVFFISRLSNTFHNNSLNYNVIFYEY